MHPKDGEIAFLAARVFSEIGDQTEELEALSATIELGYEVNRSRLSRALLYSITGRREEARKDLYEIVISPTATVFELGPALQYLQSFDEQWVHAVEQALDRPDTEFLTLIALSTFIMMNRDALPVLAQRMERSVHSTFLNEKERKLASNIATLACIGSGRFAAAQELTGIKNGFDNASLIQDIFNYAIAEWAQSRSIPVTLFEAVADRAKNHRETAQANLHQCLALAYAALGRAEVARTELHAAHSGLMAGDIVFSCWRYLNVSGEDMTQDLQTMEDLLDTGQPLEPPFFQEVRQILH